jgi:hypothetical protein
VVTSCNIPPDSEGMEMIARRLGLPYRSFVALAATDPRSSTRVILASSAGRSWTGLPWRAVPHPRHPAVAPAGVPAARGLRRHTKPATSAVVLPWANRSAACRRRRSNHSRSPGGRSTRPSGDSAARLMPGSIAHSNHQLPQKLYKAECSPMCTSRNCSAQSPYGPYCYSHRL